MTRGPMTLAALASAAVPDLDPVSVEPVLNAATSRYDVAIVQDASHRRWVIRCPRSGAASAQLEQSAALTQLLSRRLRLAVPVVKGWVALPEGGRAAVYPYLTGQVVDLAALRPGPGLTASLGRAIATVHNLDAAIYDEAGAPTYDPGTYRARRLADLDRAAATGRVPTGLLTRWEGQLEDVGWWRFAPVPTIGRLSGEQVVVVEAESGELEVKALLGWEDAQVADPADDLAGIVGTLDEEALDTFLEAYAYTRVERPDRHLVERARLASEMRLVAQMMGAVAAGDLDAADALAADLRALDAEVAAVDASAGERAMSPDAVPGDPAPSESEPTEDPAPIESEPTDDPAPTESEPTDDPAPTESEPTDDPAPTESEPTDDTQPTDTRPAGTVPTDDAGPDDPAPAPSEPVGAEDEPEGTPALAGDATPEHAPSRVTPTDR